MEYINEKLIEFNNYLKWKNNEEIFGINSKAHLAEASKMLNKRIINKHLDEQFQNGVFWFVWAMTFIFNGGLTCGVYFLYKSNKKYDDITVPALIYVMGIFNVIYILLGLILMFIPSVKFTLALILELILKFHFVE